MMVTTSSIIIRSTKIIVIKASWSRQALKKKSKKLVGADAFRDAGW